MTLDPPGSPRGRKKKNSLNQGKKERLMTKKKCFLLVEVFISMFLLALCLYFLAEWREQQHRKKALIQTLEEEVMLGQGIVLLQKLIRHSSMRVWEADGSFSIYVDQGPDLEPYLAGKVWCTLRCEGSKVFLDLSQAGPERDKTWKDIPKAIPGKASGEILRRTHLLFDETNLFVCSPYFCSNREKEDGVSFSLYRKKKCHTWSVCCS